MDEIKQVKAPEPIPWQVKAFVLIVLFGIGFLYIYNKFVVVCRLGPVPVGWYEVPRSKSIEHVVFQPREIRRIRCDVAISHTFVLPDPYRIMVWITQTNTPKLDLQVYHLKPAVIADVARGKPMWVQLCQHVSENGEEAFSDAEIHIHSAYTSGDIAGPVLEDQLR